MLIAAAFHAREQRRLKERSTANDSDPSSAMSTAADAATSLNSVSNRSIDEAPSCSIVIPPPPPPYHQPPAPSISSWHPSVSTTAHPAVLFYSRSLKNKLPDLHQHIYSSVDLRSTFITESWLNSSVTDSMLDPRNLFNIFRCDRVGRAGGGVCAMFPRKFRSHEHRLSPDDHSISMKSGCELVCIDTQLDQSKYRIILIYRPSLPSCNLNDVNEKNISTQMPCN